MKITKRICTVAVMVALSGCASTSGGNSANDPFEGYNRAAYSFNETLDKVALKPAATAYEAILPQFVQTAIGNFFGNIGDLYSAVNQLLQGKINEGVSTIMRVSLNTTFGLGGVLDISSEAGLTKHKSDFGVTLGVWGVGAGPYVVLPLLGPTTLRDTVALPADIYGDVWSYKYPVNGRNIGYGVRLIDRRAQLLDATTLLEDAALDKYVFVRDAYLQSRQARIDGGRDYRPMDKSPATTDDPGLSPGK
ncbi:VacJ family lipoprotein [Herbaspirillum sp. RTI4]|uniref:MlaA family lipoprotein n=1 Tax=Herbaspirillum sp. RTI4 TaxID=3048640 RepID=UPI002AB5494A|nr:VacJ family lipoprotein [Herbaspirillum sp. RTI4]MDY7577739.1 VacJ family lipoprotein [Herbaspirillum sp. RTI4]MEA9980833.1 VacJ family lipoprotein [Herbaspirillum sp. RTI4]